MSDLWWHGLCDLLFPFALLVEIQRCASLPLGQDDGDRRNQSRNIKAVYARSIDHWLDFQRGGYLLLTLVATTSNLIET